MRDEHTALYTRLGGIRGDFYWTCIYCGQPADTIDHVPPVSRIDDYRAMDKVRELFVTVHCCRQCNNILGNSLQPTIIDRCEYLKDKLARRMTRVTLWSDDELGDIGPNLRSKLIENNRRDKMLSDRVNYYVGIDHIIALLDV